jgi:hypothetical protein
VWDGAAEQIKLMVDASNSAVFLGNHDWKQMKEILVDPNNKVDLMVEGNRVVNTRLV